MSEQRGPIETAHALAAAAAGDMSLAIVRRDAPPERIEEWIRQLSAAIGQLKRKLGA